MIGIYKITNLINDKVYIGQSSDIKRRWKDHCKDAFWKHSPCYEYPLYRAIRKYGLDNFSFDIIEECDASELNTKEKFYIAQYDSYKIGYNQTEGGESATHSLKLTQQQVLKIIQRLKTTRDNIHIIARDFNVGGTTIHYINKGQQYPQPNEKYPIRAHLTTLNATKPTCPICGNLVSRKHLLCLTCACALRQKATRPQPLELARMIQEKGFEATGRQFGVSGKTVAKWCKNYQIPHRKQELVSWYNERIGNHEPPIIRPRLHNRIKPVTQIDIKTGQILNTFKSAAEAGRSLGKSRGVHILEVCRGKRTQAYGYSWAYA